MLTQCPNCTWSDEVEDEFLGQQAECPSCENDFIVKTIETPAKTPNKLSLAKPSRTKVTASRTNRPSSAEHNPYSAPRSSTTPRRRSSAAAQSYPGIGRLHYFLISLGLNILAIIPILGMIIALVGGIYIVVQRLKNIGYTPWLAILAFIPIANIWLGFVCIACPEGYADYKELDTAGKIIAGVFIGIFVLAMVALVFAFSVR